MDLKKGYLIPHVKEIASVNQNGMNFHQVRQPFCVLEVQFITERFIPIRLWFTQILKEDLDCSKQRRHETERIVELSNDSEN